MNEQRAKHTIRLLLLAASLLLVSKLQAATPFISVLDYGADPTGAADSTRAIQAAINAMPTTGSSTVYFPAGRYKVSSSINLNQPGSYIGDGMGSTIISTTVAAGDVFVVAHDDVDLGKMGFQASVTRAGGYYVSMPSSHWRVHIHDLNISGYAGGIQVNGVDGLVQYCNIISATQTSSVGVDITQSYNFNLNNINIEGGTAVVPFAGIAVTHGEGGMYISNCGLEHCGYALLVDSTAGISNWGVYCTNCSFDASTHGLYASANGSGGYVGRLKFVNCWFSGSTQNGATIGTSTGGIVDGIEFVNCAFVNNANLGLFVNDSGCTNIRVADSHVCGNRGQGIFLNAGVQRCSFIGNRIGNGFQFPGNTNWGMVLQGSNKNLIITSNDFTGNGTGEITGTATNSVIANNL